MQTAHVQDAARRLLNGNTIIPIPIESIVAARGIKLCPFDLGEETSGLLVIENGEATIGYNTHESKVRNRFTIAHELGHYELHRDQDQHLFIDKGFKVMFRSSQPYYSDAQIKEREANEFAASILMPESLLREELVKLDLDYTDETAIRLLAKRFGVSSVAMSYRIANLNL
jgi:Zn-dependent peptidase ImmA (M78 family)